MLHNILSANAGSALPVDPLLLLVHAVMLDTDFVGASAVRAVRQHV